ncbi:MAG: hypothetical protein CME19_02205 [Gemmatimonadetes bacterium]|nr:hypothetical protein [Gemmatimonadota bacterium]
MQRKYDGVKSEEPYRAVCAIQQMGLGLSRHRFLRASTVLVAAVGAAATVLWLVEVRLESWDRARDQALLCLVITAALTTVNLGLRWLRWHYISRRLGFLVRIRDSYSLFTVTLPAIATPYYLGELVRGLVLRRRYPGASAGVLIAWVLERSADIAALLVLMLALSRQAAIAAGVVSIWFTWFFVLAALGFGPAVSIVSKMRFSITVAVTSLVAWTLPVLGLWITLDQLDSALPLHTTAEAFVSGTLLGGVTGIPLGTGVTGSLTASRLMDAGGDSQQVPIAVAVMRCGTAWFSLSLGLIAAYFWRERIIGLARNAVTDDHFEEIAEEYDDQIPEHIRTRLLSRKTDRMISHLTQAGLGVGSVGVDLGCGQGWYLEEMTRAGYHVQGIDAAFGQIKASSGRLIQGDAGALPYADSTFDFAYAINVFHHILDPNHRSAAFREVIRILKPGGLFYLHEINTRNPLFALYMSYLFPVLTAIDEGDEVWIRPDALPSVAGATWIGDIDYFTFLPNFVPKHLTTVLAKVEGALEVSPARVWSAHYTARLRKL